MESDSLPLFNWEKGYKKFFFPFGGLYPYRPDSEALAVYFEGRIFEFLCPNLTGARGKNEPNLNKDQASK